MWSSGSKIENYLYDEVRATVMSVCGGAYRYGCVCASLIGGEVFPIIFWIKY